MSVQGIDGSCDGCREVRERCGICIEEIGRGGYKGGIAAKKEGVFVMMAFVVKKEQLFVTMASAVKAWT